MTHPHSQPDSREVLIHTICPHIKQWCDIGDEPVTVCNNCPATVKTSQGEGVQMCRLNAEKAADAILALPRVIPDPKTAALLPCPFCGGEPQMLHGGPGNWFVQCIQCKAASNDVAEDRAFMLWNTRAPAQCTCQNQHRRGYCTEPGCPYSLTSTQREGQ